MLLAWVIVVAIAVFVLWGPRRIRSRVPRTVVSVRSSARGSIVGLTALAAVIATSAASAAMPPLYRNCGRLNDHYPHGVGMVGAKDAVNGSTKPVTTFKRSSRLYALAISHNKGLDRDHDGIACEKQ